MFLRYAFLDGIRVLRKQSTRYLIVINDETRVVKIRFSKEDFIFE